MNSAVETTTVDDVDLIDETEHRIRLIRATQRIRTRQSRTALPLVVLMSFTFLIGYYDVINFFGWAMWASLLLLTSLIKSVLSRKIAPEIDEADYATLQRNERILFATSILNGLVGGSGIWWLGLTAANSAVNYAVVLFIAVYASASLVNSSVKFETFVPTTICILGQSVLFFSGIGGAWDPALVTGVVILLLLQISLSRVNSQQFEQSIRVQSENLSLVNQLSIEKAAVDKALIQAENANESKNQFLAAASHDLRQPLHALSLYLGSLELLVKDDQSASIVRKLNHTAAFLNDQFNSLLDLSQFDAGAIRAEQVVFRMDELLRRLMISFDNQLQEKGLTLVEQYEPLTVVTDPALVERIVRNLVENAIRYTDEGEIRISLSTNNNLAEISIEDTGQGISEEDQSRIFDDFVQLDNKSRNRDHGVGLGLAIVRRINTLLNLRLKLTSIPGEGSNFHFSVKKAAIHLDDTRQEMQMTTEGIGEGVVVWTVDDDVEVGEAMQMQLTSWGCQSRLLRNWSEMQQAHLDANAWPDLLLIDDMLGDEQSGLDIAKRIADQMNRDHIVLVTGNTLPERIQEIRDSSFKYLLKPASTNDLKNLIINAT